MIADLVLALAGGGDVPPIDPDEARRAADDILSDAAYAEPTQSLLDRAVEWLFDRIGSVFDRLPGGGPGSGIAWVFVVALLVLAVWLIVRALRAPSVGKDLDEPGVRYGTETTRDAKVWLDEAARLAGDGDHRGALRCRHQALVARLVTDGVVADIAGRTAGEYQRAAGDALPEEAPRLHDLTDRFDGVWYGGRSVDADGYSTFEAACRAVEASSHGSTQRATEASA